MKTVAALPPWGAVSRVVQRRSLPVAYQVASLFTAQSKPKSQSQSQHKCRGYLTASCGKSLSSHLPANNFPRNQSHSLSIPPHRSITRSAEPYIAYGFTKKLFDACAIQANYTIPEKLKIANQIPKTPEGEDIGEGSGWWYEDIGLLPTFSSWSQITFLNMYLITVRLRALPTPESYRSYSRHFFDHFSHEAERRMDVLHGITSGGIRVKYLKDLFLQWRGVLAAYDEGLIKGDAELAAAVWRNLWKASETDSKGNDLDWTKVAAVVLFLRENLHRLSQVDEGTLLQGLSKTPGQGFFAPPENDGRLIKYTSKGLTEPFEV
ncbi:Protein cbp3, mitochondrial [Myotisia sp. PD_48]|nr:Protein cbp3, mitochondrial [Myotisia sp. PD_48]